MIHFEDFNNRLISSISSYMTMYEEYNKGYWVFNKINLRYAIERELYFTFINRVEYFYGYYVNKLINDDMRTYTKDVLKLMLEQQVNIQPYANTYKMKLHKVNKYNRTDSILVSIISLKFLKYIEPILNELDSKFILLCMYENNELTQYIKNKGYDFINFDYNKVDTNLPTHLDGLWSAKMLNPLLNIILQVKPCTIINMEGCHISDQILCEIGNYFGVKTVCIQHGYAPDYANTFQNLNYTKFLTWGDYFSDGFRQYSQQTNFIPVGNHIVGKKTKHITNVKTIAFFLQAVKYFITQKDFDEFINLIIKVAMENPNINILVREHPSNQQALSSQSRDSLLAFNNIKFVNFDKYSIYDVLIKADLAVSYTSSSLIESIALGVIPIYINPFNLTIFDRLLNIIDVPMVSNIDTAYVLIRKLISDDNFTKEIHTKMQIKQEYFFANSKDVAIQNIIHCVEDSL